MSISLPLPAGLSFSSPPAAFQDGHTQPGPPLVPSSRTQPPDGPDRALPCLCRGRWRSHAAQLTACLPAAVSPATALLSVSVALLVPYFPPKNTHKHYEYEVKISKQTMYT